MPSYPNRSVIGSIPVFRGIVTVSAVSHTALLDYLTRPGSASCTCSPVTLVQVIPSAGQCRLQRRECTCKWQFTVYNVPITYVCNGQNIGGELLWYIF